MSSNQRSAPNQQDLSAGEVSGDRLPSPEAVLTAGSFGPREPHFSPIATFLYGIVLLACIAFIAWVQVSIPRLDRVPSPERALALTIGHTMDLEDALIRVSAWERWLYEITTGGADELAQATTWYEELVAFSQDPIPHLYLAILEGEAGHLDRLRERTDAWGLRPEPFPVYQRLIRAAYLGPSPEPQAELRLQAVLAELLPAGWFYDRLAIRLAIRAGDRGLLASTEEAQAMRARRLLWRYRVLTGIDLAFVVLGSLALVVIRKRWRGDLRVGAAPIPPVWRGWVGVAVLVRGGAIGAVLTVAFLFVGVDEPLLRLVTAPLVSLPLLVLAYRHLLSPSSLGFGQGLGLRVTKSAWTRLGLVVPAVLAAALVGEWVIGLVAGSVSLSSHWTEWFDSDLVWGAVPVVTVSLIEYVVFAPLFEEIAFRGLLFATLRRRFGVAASAAVSAGMFAIAHGYGVLGFASVFWSGLVWAWVYEQTGSLVPGIAAHVVNNLMVLASVLVLLRLD